MLRVNTLCKYTEARPQNGQFIRFADDVVNVAYNYEDALKIEAAFYAHCDKSGIKINVKIVREYSFFHKKNKSLGQKKTLPSLVIKFPSSTYQFLIKQKTNLNEKYHA